MMARTARGMPCSGRPSRRGTVLWLLTALVVASALMSHLPYTWCVAAARASLHDCCPGVHPTPDAPAVSALRCCEHRNVGAMPSGTVAQRGAMAVPPPERVLRVAVVVWIIGGLVSTERTPPRRAVARAGPTPPLYAMHCVWRC